MNLAALIALSFAMSVDSFIICSAKGTLLKKPKLSQALKIALIFTFSEVAAASLGWTLGHIINQWIEAWDHWIAFTLLSLLGIKMISSAALGNNEPSTEDNSPQSFLLFIFIAIITSMDSMAIGISLSTVQELHLYTMMICIAIATLIMSTAGVLLGQFLVNRCGRYTEALGGIILLIIACSILYQHVS